MAGAGDGEGILEGSACAGGLDRGDRRERTGGGACARRQCLDRDPLDRPLDDDWKRRSQAGTGHTRSPLEKHRQWLLDLVAAQPDLTVEEIRVRLRSEKKL